MVYSPFSLLEGLLEKETKEPAVLVGVQKADEDACWVYSIPESMAVPGKAAEFWMKPHLSMRVERFFAREPTDKRAIPTFFTRVDADSNCIIADRTSISLYLEEWMSAEQSGSVLHRLTKDVSYVHVHRADESVDEQYFELVRDDTKRKTRSLNDQGEAYVDLNVAVPMKRTNKQVLFPLTLYQVDAVKLRDYILKREQVVPLRYMLNMGSLRFTLGDNSSVRKACLNVNGFGCFNIDTMQNEVYELQKQELERFLPFFQEHAPKMETFNQKVYDIYHRVMPERAVERVSLLE